MACTKYIFLFILTLFSCAKAAEDLTHYVNGVESIINGSKSKYTQRLDNIIIGGPGGFSGYRAPSAKCKVLYINLSCSADTAQPNISQAPSSFPATVEQIFIQGDAAGYAALVQNGGEFALPDPAPGTIVRFNLTTAPTDSPLSWFKSPSLAASCWLCIEPNAQDPFIDTVLPINGSASSDKPSRVLIGSRVTPGVGFSDLLALAPSIAPVWFQRHPDLTYHNSFLAPLTLQEETIFSGRVNGLSFDWIGTPGVESGGCAISFMQQSDIVNPTEAAGLAGFYIDSNRVLRVYDANKSILPGIKTIRGAGGYSNVEIEVVETTGHKKSALSPIMTTPSMPVVKMPTIN